MADREHLNIIHQGVKTWNEWREEKSDVETDLEKADLRKVDLCKADLRETDLRKANLQGADLRGAHFGKANLREANLSEANLRGAHFIDTDLFKVNMNETDLTEANLEGSTLNGAQLNRAQLRGANLRWVTLNWTELVGADLSGADLREARLIQTNLSDATLTGVRLYGSSRDDWIIERIMCDYVYWDDMPLLSKKGKEEQQWLRAHRVPKNRDFSPGEFEELYKQLPTFDYYFEHGFTPIDPLIMNQVVQTVKERRPEIELKLATFDARGQAHATFTVLHKEAIETAKQEVARNYEERLAALEGNQEQMMQLMTALVNNPQKIEVILGNKQITTGNNYIETIKGDSFESSGGAMNIAKDQGRAIQSNEVTKVESGCNTDDVDDTGLH